MGRTILIALSVVILVKAAFIANLVVAHSHSADDMIALAPINVAANWR